MTDDTPRADPRGGSLWPRRRLLLTGLAGASATVLPGAVGSGAVPGVPGSRAAAALPLVKPVSSQWAYSALGVCALPQKVKTPYRYIASWMAALDQTGATYFRGRYEHGTAATAEATRAARSHGITWNMTVCPDLAYSDTALVARIKHIGANAADVCLHVEGINEPNVLDGTVPTDWARRTVAKQRVIWQTVKSTPALSHVKVLGPKLNAKVGDESHYRQLGDAGIAQYMDIAAIPCYPGGTYPYDALNQRLTWVRNHWGAKPVWITETGYTNALAATTGHAVVPEDVAAVYAPSLLLEAVDHGCRVSIFELLDTPDGAAKDNTEHNFGLYACVDGGAPPWRAKPAVSSLRTLLSALRDPGPAYDPARIQLSVTSAASDVQRTVTAKRDGRATVHLRRAKDCWDPVRKVRLPVPEVAVKIQTPNGTRTVMVDHRVRSVPL